MSIFRAFFGDVWGNLWENPSNSQKFACPTPMKPRTVVFATPGSQVWRLCSFRRAVAGSSIVVFILVLVKGNVLIVDPKQGCTIFSLLPAAYRLIL